MPDLPIERTLEIRCFGPPCVIVDGEEIRPPLKRAVALLIYLAFHERPVPRSHLAAMLWPDSEEVRARTRLRRLIYTVEEFCSGLLFTRGDCVGLTASAVTVDFLAFGDFARRIVESSAWEDASLSAAEKWAKLARLPFLLGLSFGSEPFDDWRQATSIEHEHLFGRLLERMIDALGDRHRFAAALVLVEELIALDVHREASYVLSMRMHALQGDAAGVEAAYARCADEVRAEFGVRPGPRTEEAYLQMREDLRRMLSHRVERHRIRFAAGAHGTVAYTVLGTGERTLVICPGFVSHIEIGLELPAFRSAVEALAERFQVILFDRRGVGLSERLGVTTTPAAAAADIAALLDHAEVPRAWIFGSSEGALGAMRFAIDRADRVDGLCLFGALAKGAAAPDYPWALPSAAYDAWLRKLVAEWGGPVGLETFAPSAKEDPVLRAWWARIVRHGASPGGMRTILSGLRDADIRQDLNRIAVPTLVMHRRRDAAVRFDAGAHVARNIPGAVWKPFDGTDHFWWCGDGEQVVEAVLDFAGRLRYETPL